MKILVLLTDLFDAVGGIQTFNRSLVRALDGIAGDLHSKVSVLVLNDEGTSARAPFYFNNSTTTYSGYGGAKPAFVAAAMREVVDASTVFLGHVNFGPLLPLLRLRNPKLKSLMAVYGIDVWNRLPLLQRRTMKSTDRIISISESTRARMTAANDLNGTPIDVVPCTLEPFYGENVSLKSRQELNLPAGRMILTTSRLDAAERYKGIDDAIRALPYVLEAVPDAFYVVVGEGTDRPRLQDLATQLGVSSSVHFTGRVKDELLPSYYNSCDVFVLPSTCEGFGIVFLEAMYYAKPCVGARASSIPEVIDEGVTGFLTEPRNLTALAKNLTSLLLDENLKLSMGKAGRARLEKEFSFDAFASRLVSTFNRV